MASTWTDDDRPRFHLAVLADRGLAVPAVVLERHLLLLLCRRRAKREYIGLAALAGEPLCAGLALAAERLDWQVSYSRSDGNHLRAALALAATYGAAVWFHAGDRPPAGALWFQETCGRVGVPVRLVGRAGPG